MMNFRLRFGFALMLACCFAGCGKSKSDTAKKAAPAKIEAHPDERDIYRITLTKEAENRLGIKTVSVVRKVVSRNRTVGGEVMLPDGAAVIVSSPVAGTVQIPASPNTPQPGMPLKTGEAVVTIKPLLSPERDVLTPAEQVQVANAQVTLLTAKIAAQGDMKTAEAQVEAADIALKRSEQLLKDRVGSARDVDDAKARLAVAEESLKAAQLRVKSLSEIRLLNGKISSGSSSEQEKAQPIPIRVTNAGVLRNLAVADGQYVPAGATLFEVIRLKTLWVRVPVYVGLLDQIPKNAEVQVRALDQSATTKKSVIARMVLAPPTADPIAATADLYFEIQNTDQRFRPGERVMVSLPLVKDQSRLVIPRTAVLRDIQGTSWVYARSGPREYRRMRILIDYTTQDWAVLESGPPGKPFGPPEGTEVVTDGTDLLFGTEFGAKK